MARAKSVIGGATGAIKAQGEATEKLRDHHSRMYHNLTQRMAGMFALFTIVKSEVSNVYNNIEKIPGIKAETLASIISMKTNLAEARQNVQQFVAVGISGFAQFGEVLGTAVSGLVRFWEKLDFKKIFDPNNRESVFSQVTGAFRAARDEMTPQSAHDDAAEALRLRNEVTDRDAILDVRRRIAQARKDERLATMDVAAQITTLRAEAERYDYAAKHSGGVRLDQLNAELKAIELRRDANQKYENLRKQAETADQRFRNAQDQENEQLTSRAERVDVLRAKLEQLKQQLPNRYELVMKKSENDDQLEATMQLRALSAEELQKEVEIMNKMTGVQLRLNSALRANGELARDLGNALATGFGRAILSGEKLSDVLRDLIGDLLQIILQRTVLNPLADVFTGGILKMLGGRAMGGPLNGPVVVGEKGPELLLPGGAGTIIPNEQLRGGRSGATYYIDAKGADTAAVSRLETLLMTLAGPGAVERRAVNAVQGASWRRQLAPV